MTVRARTLRPNDPEWLFAFVLLFVPVALLVLTELVELLPRFMLFLELPPMLVEPEPPSAPIVEPVPAPSAAVLLPPVVPLLVAELPVIGLLAP